MVRASHPRSVIEDDRECLVSDNKVHPGRDVLTIVTVILGIAVILVVYLLRLDPAVGVFNDDGWYLVLAKSLATGHGYNLINLPHAGHSFYPPFFPFLLSCLYRIWPDFPRNVILLKSLSIVAVFLLGFIVFRLFDRPGRLSRPLALLLAVCTALAPPFVMMATSTLMSECVFTTLQFAAVVFAERCIRDQSDKGKRGTALATALLAAAAYLTRAAGVALLLAIGLDFLRRKMFKELALFVVTALLCASAWSIYTHLYSNPTEAVPGYSSQFWQQRAGIPGRIGVRDLPARVWRQATVIVFDDVGVLFAPSLYRTGSESGEELMNMTDLIPWLNHRNSKGVPLCTMGLNLGVQLISFGFSALVLIGFLLSVRRGPELIDLLFLFSLAIIVLWPWDPIRFLVPLFPIFLYYLILGIAELSRPLRVVFKSQTQVDVWKASRIVTLCILGFFIFDHASYLIAKQSGPGSSEYPEWLVNFNAERQAAVWVRDHTTPNEIVAADYLPLTYLYSERKTDSCDFRDCENKGIRYRIQFDSIQSLNGKTVFESHGKRVLELRPATP